MPSGKHATIGLRIDVSCREQLRYESVDSTSHSFTDLSCQTIEHRGTGSSRNTELFNHGVTAGCQLSEPISPAWERHLDKLMGQTVDTFFISDQDGFSRFQPFFSNSPAQTSSCEEAVLFSGKRKLVVDDGMHTRESTPDASPTSTTWNDWSSHTSRGSEDDMRFSARNMDMFALTPAAEP